MTSVDSNCNFLCGRPHGAGPPLFPSTCVHLSPTPLSPPCGRHKWMAPNHILQPVPFKFVSLSLICWFPIRRCHIPQCTVDEWFERSSCKTVSTGSILPL